MRRRREISMARMGSFSTVAWKMSTRFDLSGKKFSFFSHYLYNITVWSSATLRPHCGQPPGPKLEPGTGGLEAGTQPTRPPHLLNLVISTNQSYLKHCPHNIFSVLEAKRLGCLGRTGTGERIIPLKTKKWITTVSEKINGQTEGKKANIGSLKAFSQCLGSGSAL